MAWSELRLQVVEARAGNREPPTPFWTAFCREVDAVAVGYGRRFRLARPDREDYVQEVRLRCWRHLPRYDPRWSLGTWVDRVAHNACRDFVRGATRRLAPLAPLLGEPAALPAAPARVEAALSVREALGHLPARRRQAVVLTQLEGHSVAEAAAILGVKPQTIRSQVRLAHLRDLAVHLSAPAPSDPGLGSVRRDSRHCR